MFIVKFNTGVELSANTVEERYGNYDSDADKSTLSIRTANSDKGMEYYRGVVEAEGALEKITVTDDTGFQTVFTEYTELQTINRSLVSGGAVVQISLRKGM